MNDKDLSKLGDYIRRLRESLGMSQEELAKKFREDFGESL